MNELARLGALARPGQATAGIRDGPDLILRIRLTAAILDLKLENQFKFPRTAAVTVTMAVASGRGDRTVGALLPSSEPPTSSSLAQAQAQAHPSNGPQASLELPGRVARRRAARRWPVPVSMRLRLGGYPGEFDSGGSLTGAATQGT